MIRDWALIDRAASPRIDSDVQAGATHRDPQKNAHTKSSYVRFVLCFTNLTSSRLGQLQTLIDNFLQQVSNAVTVTPLVVIPANQLEEVAVQFDSRTGIVDR
jgi:hypothetical protein